MKRSWKWITAKIIVAALLLGASLCLLDWQTVSASLERIHPAAFAIAVLLLLPENALLAIRWHYIVRSDIPLPILEHARRYFLSIFISSFTPATIGGDLYRFLSLRKMARNNWQMAGLILRERMIGIAGHALFYLMCVALYLLTAATNDPALAKIYWLGAACFAVGLLGLYASPAVLGVLRHKLHLVSRASDAKYGELLRVGLNMGRPKNILCMQVLSLCTCGIWTFSILVVAWDLEMEVGFVLLGMAGILTDLVRQIPVSVQGIGVREATFATLLWAMGFPLEQGFVLGLASYLAVTVAVAAVGGIGFMMPVSTEKPPAAAAGNSLE